MQVAPGRQTWHEPATGKRIGRRNPQELLLTSPLNRKDASSKCLKTFTYGRKQPFSRAGKRYRPGPAAEQRATAIALQKPDLVADSSRSDAELRCGLLEAQMPATASNARSSMRGGNFSMATM